MYHLTPAHVVAIIGAALENTGLNGCLMIEKTLMRKKYLVCIMAAVMLMIVLFSSFFIAAHADHECDGRDCPVCACIQQCEKNLRGFGDGMTAGISAVMPLLVFLLSVSIPVCSLTGATPVSQKVRLNN